MNALFSPKWLRAPRANTIGVCAFAAAQLCLLPALSGAAPAAQGQTLSVLCDFEPPRLETHGGCSRVIVPGCGTLQRVGEPVLPFRTVRLLLPPQSVLVKVEVQIEAPEAELPGFWLIEHGLAPVRTPDPDQPTPAPTITEPAASIYLSAGPYPAVRAELGSLQRMAGHDIAFVRVFPVQYRPRLGQLTFATRLRLVLSLSPRSPALDAASGVFGPSAARSRVAALVDNPAMLNAYGSAGATYELDTQSTFDYLLITRSNLVTAFQPLVNQKSQAGLSVRIETVENITNSYAGRDLPEKIRNCIRYACTNWGITYALLGGDVSVVPCRYAYGYVYPSSHLIPCDLYFACLDGSWNADNDNLFGEPTDGEGGGDVDLLAEVVVGRAPVETVAEVNTFVEKTLRYETQPHLHATNALFMAEYLGDFPGGPAQGGDMFDPLAPLFRQYQVSWLDDRPFSAPQWTRANALNAMNGSPHLVLLNGHGTDDILIGANEYFIRAVETSELDQLTNQWPFVAYSVGCNAGQFDNPAFLSDCIGEELVKRHSRGAFAAVLNSRFGWYDQLNEVRYSGEFQQQFFIELLKHGQTNFGVANQLSKHGMIGCVESSGNMTYRFCYYEITLFGDPHLSLKAPVQLPAFSLALSLDGQGGCVLNWPSASNRLYAIYQSTNLTVGSFVLLTNNLPATPPMNTYTDTLRAAGKRFYKVSVSNAP